MKKYIAIIVVSSLVVSLNAIRGPKKLSENSTAHNEHVNRVADDVNIPKANVHAAVEVHKALKKGDEKKVRTFTNGIRNSAVRNKAQQSIPGALQGNPVSHVELNHYMINYFDEDYFNRIAPEGSGKFVAS